MKLFLLGLIKESIVNKRAGIKEKKNIPIKTTQSIASGFPVLSSHRTYQIPRRVASSDSQLEHKAIRHKILFHFFFFLFLISIIKTVIYPNKITKGKLKSKININDYIRTKS
jgi:hypothetical protein